MTVVDDKSFPSIGEGMWWSVQTVTTVGYGDRVPADTLGKVLAAVVMLLGVAFVTVITAAITSAFVAREEAGGEPTPTAHQLRSIDERLARIEAALRETQTPG
jgi:voltage-gated potassium channel